jgi:hypothetical protein
MNHRPHAPPPPPAAAPRRAAHDPAAWLRRVFENAGLLAFACLTVMSLVLGRYSAAMLWGGAALVFFAHAWQTRLALPSDAAHAAGAARGADLLRWIGVAFALAGAAALAL